MCGARCVCAYADDVRGGKEVKKAERNGFACVSSVFLHPAVGSGKLDRKGTEVPEIQDEERPKSMAPPPYSPNAWAELAQILGGWPLGG